MFFYTPEKCESQITETLVAALNDEQSNTLEYSLPFFVSHFYVCIIFHECLTKLFVCSHNVESMGLEMEYKLLDEVVDEVQYLRCTSKSIIQGPRLTRYSGLNVPRLTSSWRVSTRK